MYKITVYCDDGDIEKTTAYSDYAGEEFVGYFGGDDLGSYDEFTFNLAVEAAESGVEFYATPTDGCSFTRWAYRVESTSSKLLYSYDNPFVYYGDYNIYIRAEGEVDEEEETWILKSKDYGTLKSDKSETISLQPYTLYRRKVVFSGNGLAIIQTTGSVDTIGWISTSQNWSDGVPIGWLYEDDDNGDGFNFCIELDVESDTTYYIWLRCNEPTSSGAATLKIDAPDIPTKWDWESAGATSDANQMKTAHDAVLYNGKTTDFSFYVWNDLCNKVNELLRYKGRTWDTFYATLLNTRMKYNDKELTAVRFNSLRNNLDFAYDTEIDKVEPDYDVLGSYFITLANAINDCIDDM